ncbi:MAG: hypothetical protein Ct9H90mP25_2680 [Gammaproteobacteria bacterium]|nr:MAG: hypothetical protein Ct9H90mP25_2680 [Gammaproteobacteria bacterium]
MSQNNFSIDSSSARTYQTSKKIALVRSLLFKVLSKASEGHFLLKENGQVVAEVGDPEAELRAEADVLTNGHTCELFSEVTPQQERLL